MKLPSQLMLAFAPVLPGGDGTVTALKMESGLNCSHIVAIGKKEQQVSLQKFTCLEQIKTKWGGVTVQ